MINWAKYEKKETLEELEAKAKEIGFELIKLDKAEKVTLTTKDLEYIKECIWKN